MVEVCARQHLMCVWGSKRNIWAGWRGKFEKYVLRLMWARWEMRVWCFVQNRFEMKRWKSGVSGEERL